MPDVTISFTDAQWARIVAATTFIMRDGDGVVDASKLAAKWKEQATAWVKAYEVSVASVDDF